MFAGIEIGGTKLQLALGPGHGKLLHLWRGTVDVERGGEGILDQIKKAYPSLLKAAKKKPGDIRAIGIGFGGPTDDATRSVVKSHHIAGWENFPICSHLEAELGSPCVLGNDADVAGLAEATKGAGRGRSPVFYITVGSGIGGGLIVDWAIYRGVGRGAAEIGHVRPYGEGILEDYSSGWGIARQYAELSKNARDTKEIVQLARRGDRAARQVIDDATQALGEAICTVIKLLCPKVIVIGGGVSLMGEDFFFEPIRRYVVERGMEAFAGLTEIVPAALGEEVVLHGAIELARRNVAAGANAKDPE